MLLQQIYNNSPRKFFFAALMLTVKLTFCQKNNEGFVLLSRSFWDSSINKYIVPKSLGSHKIWYKGNKAIRQESEILWEEKGDSIICFEERSIRYYYIDLKKRTFYEYNQFNKDCTFTKKYVVYDSMLKHSSFGYIFWGFKDSSKNFLFPNEKYYPLPDTTINNIHFKRESCNQTVSFNDTNILVTFILYYRTDIKKTIFHFNKEFDLQRGMCVTKVEIIEPNIKQCLELNYVRQKLTKEERKVFRSWKRKVKKITL